MVKLDQWQSRKEKALGKSAIKPERFSTFGELLKYLRRREELTQIELAIQVGYSDTQISRLEQNQRVPDAATITALFVPALHLEREPEWTSRLLELANKARRGEDLEPERAGKPGPKNNLPASLTTFIGREKEQNDVRELMAKHRLVTLTGSGGIGKTRFAIEVGGQILDDFDKGVWLVELASLSDAELLSQTVASIFEIVPHAKISYTQLLINFLRTKSVLLILDNCEHLLDACAALTDTLLKNCPQLKILATSRAALGILGEMQYRLPSLGVPDVQQTLEQFREFEAVRLFEERAQLKQPDFKVTRENAASVAQICSRLDGIPLAIELAAARLNIFSTAQIAARLEDGFNLLTGGSRTALPRQQTIRASIDWSWNLISEAERMLLQRLTVFAGGWTLEAAEAVCRRDDREDVPDLLTQLVAKSLVIANRKPGREPRFRLHETIRQYAHERLLQAGEDQNIYSQHLRYFLELTRQAELASRGPQQMEWFDRLVEERDNFRAALEYASRTDLEAGLYLSAGLLNHWYSFGVPEGLGWTTRLIQSSGSQSFPHARARATLARGNMLWNQQQFEAARSAAQECLEAFRVCGDRQGEYDSLMALGRALQFLEGMEERTKVHLQALALARSMNDLWRQAEALSMLGWDQRDPHQGRAYWEEAIVLWRQLGAWFNLAQTLGIMGFTDLSNGDLESAEQLLNEAYEINLQTKGKIGLEFILTGKSQLCLLRGEYKQARAFLQEDIETQEEAGNRMGYLWGRARLAQIALCEGNVAEANEILVDVIESFYADQNKNGLVFALDRLASLFAVTDNSKAAAQLLGGSDAIRKEIGDPRQRLQQDDLDRSIAAIIAEIGDSAYETAYHAGQKMTFDEVVSLALGVRK